MEKKRTGKFIFAMILSVCMVFTMMPSIAFAAPEEVEDVDNVKAGSASDYYICTIEDEDEQGDPIYEPVGSSYDIDNDWFDNYDFEICEQNDGIWEVIEPEEADEILWTLSNVQNECVKFDGDVDKPIVYVNIGQNASNLGSATLTATFNGVTVGSVKVNIVCYDYTIRFDSDVETDQEVYSDREKLNFSLVSDYGYSLDKLTLGAAHVGYWVNDPEATEEDDNSHYESVDVGTINFDAKTGKGYLTSAQLKTLADLDLDEDTFFNVWVDETGMYGEDGYIDSNKVFEVMNPEYDVSYKYSESGDYDILLLEDEEIAIGKDDLVAEYYSDTYRDGKDVTITSLEGIEIAEGEENIELKKSGDKYLIKQKDDGTAKLYVGCNLQGVDDPVVGEIRINARNAEEAYDFHYLNEPQTMLPGEKSSHDFELYYRKTGEEWQQLTDGYSVKIIDQYITEEADEESGAGGDSMEPTPCTAFSIDENDSFKVNCEIPEDSDVYVSYAAELAAIKDDNKDELLAEDYLGINVRYSALRVSAKDVTLAPGTSASLGVKVELLKMDSETKDIAKEDVTAKAFLSGYYYDFDQADDCDLVTFNKGVITVPRNIKVPRKAGWVMIDAFYDYDDEELSGWTEVNAKIDYPAVGTVKATPSGDYVITAKGRTVSLAKAISVKTYILPAAVNIDGVNYAVTGIAPYAFQGTKVKTIKVQTPNLSKASVKNSLKKSKVKKIKVQVGTKKVNKKFAKAYKKIFKKKNSGKSVRVSR